MARAWADEADLHGGLGREEREERDGEHGALPDGFAAARAAPRHGMARAVHESAAWLLQARSTVTCTMGAPGAHIRCSLALRSDLPNHVN